MVLITLSSVKIHSHGATMSVTTSTVFLSQAMGSMAINGPGSFTQTLASATSVATYTSIVKSFFTLSLTHRVNRPLNVHTKVKLKLKTELKSTFVQENKSIY